MKDFYRPGENVPTSGQAGIYNTKGKPIGREVTVVKNEHFPPAPKKGYTFRIDDLTKK